MHIFGKEMVKSWPEFYADHDGTNGFWKFWDFDQNNPVLKFDTFLADISVQVHAIGPKFDLMDSFSTLIKVNQKVIRNSKVLQNLGITFESRLYRPWDYVPGWYDLFWRWIAEIFVAYDRAGSDLSKELVPRWFWPLKKIYSS